MGKVDQGVITLWVGHHYFGLPLQYIGFGGQGKQVRDVLHVNDLAELVMQQIALRSAWNGAVFNVGGGEENSVSLRELTRLCREVCGRRVEIASWEETSPLDVRIYQTDARAVRQTFSWRPHRSLPQIVGDIQAWIHESEPLLEGVLS
jgi:CDP-paratose 2-epimerase